MNIVLATYHFYPTQTPRAFRAGELACELSSQGHDVLVICGVVTEEVITFANQHGFKVTGLFKKSLKPFSKFGKLNRYINRVTQLFFEYPYIRIVPRIKKEVTKVSNADLLISIAVPYPVHWGISLISNKEKRHWKYWAADCGDPFMGDESDSFRHPFYFKYIEQYFMRKADKIVVPTNEAYKGYFREFHNKITVIPQGFNFAEAKKNISEIGQKTDTLKFAYAGGFIPGYREPYEFLDYLCEVDLDFIFYIYTDNKINVNKYKDLLGDKLLILDRVSRNELLKKLSSVDFVVNFANKGRAQTPSKLIDYYLLDKPILQVEFKTMNKRIADEFMRKNYVNKLQLENPAQYDISNVAKRFTSLIN